MGSNDDREMLDVAREECTKLERELAYTKAALEHIKTWYLDASVLEKQPFLKRHNMLASASPHAADDLRRLLNVACSDECRTAGVELARSGVPYEEIFDGAAQLVVSLASGGSFTFDEVVGKVVESRGGDGDA